MNKEALIHCIENYAPPCLQAEWDNSGIQIESCKEDFNHLAVMLDISQESLENALKIGADCILSHHPLAISPYFLNKNNALFNTITTLIKKDCLIYSAHTSLDSKFEGFSSWIANDFKLENVQELDTIHHFGAIGNVHKAISFDECIDILLKSMPFMQKESFRLIGNLANAKNTKIERIAFCTGSGSELYSLAQREKADIFITGDVKYHTALDAIDSINIKDAKQTLLLDVGHFSLEEEMMRRFASALASSLPIKVDFISSNNPFSIIK